MELSNQATAAAELPAAMTIKEFSAWARLGRTSIYKQAKAGRLKLRKIGDKTVILRADAEAWLRSLPESRAA